MVTGPIKLPTLFCDCPELPNISPWVFTNKGKKSPCSFPSSPFSLISALQPQGESVRRASGAIKNSILNFQRESFTKHTHMYTHTPHSVSRQNSKGASKIPAPPWYIRPVQSSPLRCGQDLLIMLCKEAKGILQM